MNSLALLLAVLGALLVLCLRCETSQRLFYLACYVFLVHLERLLRTVLLLFLSTALLTTFLATIWLLRYLTACRLYVNALLSDALTLLLLAVLRSLLCSLLLTFAALLLLRFLSGASTLVQFVEVYGSEHLHLWREFLLALQCEHAALFLLLCCRFRLLLRLFGLFGLLHDSLFRLRLLHLHWLRLRFFLWFRLFLHFFFHHWFRLFLSLWLRNGFLNLLHRLLHRFLHLWFRLLFLLFNGLHLLLLRSRLANILKVDFPERCELLLRSSLHFRLNTLLALLLFLVLGLLREQFVGINLHFLVFLERLNERVILRIVEFETRLSLHFTEILAFLKEFDCRLKSYVQFSYYLI